MSKIHELVRMASTDMSEPSSSVFGVGIDLEPSNIELRMLNYRLKILSIKKKSLHKLMHPLVKIAFTNKTKCSFFAFDETNDDYSVIVDNYGFDELSPYLNETDITLSQSDWIPMYLSGEDLPGSMSISKIAKYLILPLADWKISIMAISMYQCDYILIQEKDYDTVLMCLSNHIPKIYDESVSLEEELVLNYRTNNPEMIEHIKQRKLSTASNSNAPASSASDSQDSMNNDSNGAGGCGRKHRQITLPLLIPDNTEYCITGLYNLETFFLIIPTLIEIMFYETDEYGDNEIFFNFTKKETDISIVMETRLLKKFPDGALLNIHNDFWKLIRIGQSPVGFEVFGVCASISQPLELANIDEYYISSFHTGYCFIPSEKLDMAKELFAKRKATFVESMSSNSKTSSLSQQQQSQPPTFLLASTVDPPEHSSSSSSSSASSSSANSDIILPMQAEKDYYESNEINYDAKYPDIADSNSNSNLNYDDLTDDMDPAKKSSSSSSTHPSHLL